MKIINSELGEKNIPCLVLFKKIIKIKATIAEDIYIQYNNQHKTHLHDVRKTILFYLLLKFRPFSQEDGQK